MSKKEHMSQLRKKLESSSRKTRRSTDLRRSLGRKSVGDLNPRDLAALEQPSTSSDESCHLNPDSAIIDPELTDNPEWFKNSGIQGVLVSHQSFNAAVEQERAANIPNTSNVEELDFSAFNPRDINQILGSHFTVDKAALRPDAGRVSSGSNRSTVESPSGDISLEPPQRKPSAFKRRPKQNSTQSNNVFSKVLEEDESEGQKGTPFKITKEIFKSHQRQFYAGSDESASNLSLERPKRKPSSFRRGKIADPKEVQETHNLFSEALEDTIDNEKEAGVGTPIGTNIPLPSSKNSSRKQNNTHSDASLDYSMKPPERKRTRFSRRTLKVKTNSQELVNKFDNILNETSDVTVEEDPLQIQEQRLLQDNETCLSNNSLELPHRKQSRFKRGAGLSSKVSAHDKNVFTQLLEESSIMGDDSGTSPPNYGEDREPSQETGVSDRMHPETHVKTTLAADVSMEIPLRKPNASRQGQKQTVLKLGHEKNPFSEVLENTATSESHAEPIDCSVDQHSKAEMIINHRKSLDNLNKEEIASSCKRNCSSIHPPCSAATKENVFPSSTKNSEVALQGLNTDSLNNTLESLPLGAEASSISRATKERNHRGQSRFSLEIPVTNLPVSDKTSRFSESLEKRNVDLICNLQIPNQGDASKLSSSITDHTRDAPALVSSIDIQGFVEKPDIHLRPSQQQRFSQDSRNSNRVSNVWTKAASKLNSSFSSNNGSAVPAPDVLEEEVPLSTSFSSVVMSPKSAVLLSRQDTSSSTKAIAATPSNQKKNSSIGNIVSTTGTEQVSKLQPRPNGDADSDSDIPDYCSADSCNEDDEENNASDSGNSNDALSSISICSAETSIVQQSGLASMTTPGSLPSNFRLESVNHSAQTSPSSKGSNLTECGSDSVFKSNQTGSISINALESSKNVIGKPMNASWPENPFLDASHESGLGRGSSKCSTERLSDVETVDKGVPWSVKRGYRKDNSSLASFKSQDIPQVDSNTSSMSTTYANTSVRNLIDQGSQVEFPGMFKIYSQSRKETPSKEAIDKGMAGLAVWFENIKRNKTVIEGRPMPASQKPEPFKKPEPPPPKGPSKKKEVCPFFGNYKPPRRVKPQPYVTNKMYKFLETKLEPKFGLESRIKAEEFVTSLCKCVQTTIKRKSKYHPLVTTLRDDMFTLGLIKTQFDFHIFIEDYLPYSFRAKSIPCYGSTKAPRFDHDLHKDLSQVL